MDQESANIEKRLKSLYAQLQSESMILDRIVYKGKNQHRRCLYFQYLSKVRRDVRLLCSVSLEEILCSIFQVINGTKPQQRVHILERMKKRKCTSERHNYQERLLGVARLLSEMVEPMVKAAIEISSLLARSFFMDFSIIILALVARLRVLVQQILLDVVSVYNMTSSFAQKKQSIKLNGGGIEVFREYYPPNANVITLECIWKTDKFVLLEKVNTCKTKSLDEPVGVGKVIPLQSSNISYQTIEAFLGEDEVDCEKMDLGRSSKDISDPVDTKRRTTDVSGNQPIMINITTETDCSTKDLSGPADAKRLKIDTYDQPIKINNITEIGSDEDNKSQESSSPVPSPKSQNKLQTEPKNKVAFVSIGKKFPPSQMKPNELPEKKAIAADWLARSSNSEEDSIFSLLTGGNTEDASLF